MPDALGRLTRDEMVATLQNRGSVLYEGNIITDEAHLPDEAALAAGDPARLTAAEAAIHTQMAQLQMQLQRVTAAREQAAAAPPPKAAAGPPRPAGTAVEDRPDMAGVPHFQGTREGPREGFGGGNVPKAGGPPPPPQVDRTREALPVAPTAQEPGGQGPQAGGPPRAGGPSPPPPPPPPGDRGRR